jgi:shikimate kinase
MSESCSEEKIAELRAEFIAGLTIPPLPDKQILLCPVGLIGAGKTTVIKPLAKRLGLVRISGDELRKIFKAHGCSLDGSVRRLSYALLEEFIAQGYGVAIDSDCATPETQEKIRLMEEHYPIKALWLHINPPEVAILHNLRNREPNWLFKDSAAAIANYEKRKPLHEKLSMSFLYTFDTSRDNLNTQLNEAERLIREERQQCSPVKQML